MTTRPNIVVDFDWHLPSNGLGDKSLGHPKSVTGYGTMGPNLERLGCFNMQSDSAWASTRLLSFFIFSHSIVPVSFLADR